VPISFNLLPREDVFYDLISESGELSYLTVRLVKHLVEADNLDRAQKLSRDIETAKNRSKAVTNEITGRLCRTFITPLDREDIHSISTALYRIPKLCEKTQERILSFNIKPFEDDLFRLSAQMAEAAEEVHYLVQNLRTFQHSAHVHDRCALLNNIEIHADELLSQLMVKLFKADMDVKELILRKDIYNLMEAIVDTHRDIGNIVLEIVLKHT
jgi:uncharacterized protein Yka (UPF0111/DUF47 family)